MHVRRVQTTVSLLAGLCALTLAPRAFAFFPEDFENLKNHTSSHSSVSSQSSNSSISSTSSTDEKAAIYKTPGAMAAIPAKMAITRAEFTALVVEKLYAQQELDACYWSITANLPPHFTLVYTDVHVEDRFAKHICIAMRDGLIKGYSDGSFKPNKQISFSEASKILVRGYDLAPYAEAHNFMPWYREYVQTLATHNAIPLNVTRLDQLMNAGDANEMVNRIHSNITWRESRTYNELTPRPVRPTAAASTPKPTVTKPSAQSSSVAPSTASSSISSKRSFWNPF